MPSLDAWLAGDTLAVTTASQRAALAWRRIEDRPTVITVIRNGAVQSAQTVRVEADNNTRRDQAGTLITENILRVTLFGIKDHATLPDNNLRRGDTFILADHPGATFEIDALLTPPGEIQALAEATQGS